MKPYVVAFVIALMAGAFVVLHLAQHGQIGDLEARQERFEKITTRALASNLIALEQTLSYQRALEAVFRRSQELRLTFAQIENYNAKTKPRNYTPTPGEYNAQTPKLLRTKSVQHSTPFGTGAW